MAEPKIMNTQAQRRAKTKDYDSAIAQGELFVQALIAKMADGRGHSYLLGWTVKAMIEQRRFGAYEVGRLSVVARSAVVGRARSDQLSVQDNNPDDGGDGFVASFLGQNH